MSLGELKIEKIFYDGPVQERIYWAEWGGMDYFSMTSCKETLNIYREI